MIPCSGVRISWDMVAKKFDLALLASFDFSIWASSVFIILELHLENRWLSALIWNTLKRKSIQNNSKSWSVHLEDARDAYHVDLILREAEREVGSVDESKQDGRQKHHCGPTLRSS